MLKKSVVFAIIFFMILYGAENVSALTDGETPSGIPLMNVEEFVDEYMAKHIGISSPGAAVVLVKDGEIILSKGYGYSDIENKIEADSDKTVFEYGSVSKLFVYTTLMRLSEQGKIDFNADIREYLPEGFLKNIQYDEPITMLNVMNHTTGFEDYLFDVVLLESGKNHPGMQETLLNSQPKQVYRPGEVSAYSNYAVALAAYISEQIIGQDFHRYLMESIFLPLEMNHTSAHPSLEDHPELLDNKAMGYGRNVDGGFTPGQWSYIPLYPVGAVNGSAEDLARFAMALMPEEGEMSPLFHDRATLDEMLTQSHPMGPELSGFAHGFIEWDGEKRGVGHGGNTAYFSSQMNIVPEERFGVIVLTNVSSEMDITSGLTEALIGKRSKEVSIAENDLPDASLVEGTYIGSRRMHTGFLEIYGYLNLLKVKALEENKIKLSMAGQTSILIQTRPHVFERVEAQGSIFDYNFGEVYFEMEGGKVKRLSGDFLPLPAGRSVPWLNAFLIIALITTLYFVITPLVLIIHKIRRKWRYSQETSKTTNLMVLCGTGLVINNAVLAIRMLSNNFRSFSEMKIHILLNYPLVLFSIMLIVYFIFRGKISKLSKARKVFSIMTMLLLIVLIGVLINWQFLKIIA